MQDVYQQIRELENIQGLSKHEQFVQGFINAINDKLLSKGDMLRSVNNLMKELGFARETIAKGYKELTSRGIVESKNRIGFYVANADTKQTLKIALVIFAFDSFQELFYKTFSRKVGKDVHIDIFFHHNNISVFEDIISRVRGKYGMYVVAPIPHKKTAGILSTLPMNKFLMVDRHEPIPGDYAYVVQEFGKCSYKAFVQLKEVIGRYKEMVYYHRLPSDIPVEILNAYKKFVRDYNIRGVVSTEYIPGSIEKGKVYFTVNNTELWAMLKDCISKKFVIGKDVGILSHNDDMAKKIICNGITTYSTDFKKMAEKAADFIRTRKKIQEVIPTVLIRRQSL